MPRRRPGNQRRRIHTLRLWTGRKLCCALYRGSHRIAHRDWVPRWLWDASKEGVLAFQRALFTESGSLQHADSSASAP
jgi:hypothetical protein